MVPWSPGDEGVIALPSGVLVRGRALGRDLGPADLTVLLVAPPFDKLRARGGLVGPPFDKLRAREGGLVGPPFDGLRAREGGLVGPPFDKLRAREEGLRARVGGLLAPPFDKLRAHGRGLRARGDGPSSRSTRTVAWPDFGIPLHRDETVEVLREAYARARAGERVEIACRGGVGRTGTALAALAVLDGSTPDEAVAWARAHHHRRAVETPFQRRWLRHLPTG